MDQDPRALLDLPLESASIRAFAIERELSAIDAKQVRRQPKERVTEYLKGIQDRVAQMLRKSLPTPSGVALSNIRYGRR